MYRILNRIAEIIAKVLALAGGLVLLAVVALTCMSIIGRAMVPFNIGLGPIRGIYDITEVAMAASIFAFLPWTQLREAHARVDLFAPVLPRTMNKFLDLVFNIAMFLMALVGTWRLYLGMMDKLSYGETTLIAQIPVWQGYAVCLVGGLGFIFVAGFCIIRSLHRFSAWTDEGETA